VQGRVPAFLTLSREQASFVPHLDRTPVSCVAEGHIVRAYKPVSEGSHPVTREVFHLSRGAMGRAAVLYPGASEASGEMEVVYLDVLELRWGAVSIVAPARCEAL
jgi:hypothetical protein